MRPTSVVPREIPVLLAHANQGAPRTSAADVKGGTLARVATPNKFSLGLAHLITPRAPSALEALIARIDKVGIDLLPVESVDALVPRPEGPPELIVLELAQATTQVLVDIERRLPEGQAVLYVSKLTDSALEQALALGCVHVLSVEEGASHFRMTLVSALQRASLRRDQGRLSKRTAHESHHDPLTGLPNGSLLRQRLELTAHNSPRSDSESCAVLFVNLDRFKNVNDSLGHSLGDTLLQRIAGRILGCVRPTDLVARLSGDEFCILLEGIADREHVCHAAGRVQRALVAPVELGGQEVFVSVSIGIALSAESGKSARHLVRDAGTAMHRAKAKGGGIYEIFDATMHDQAAVALQLENRLRRAVARAEFIVYYQPIVSLTTGETRGFEALVRWQSPELGLVQPSSFIPIAEQTGLVVPLGLFVLETACKQAQIWNHDRAPDERIFVSVNISPRQFHHAGLEEDIARIMRETQVDPTTLKLEVTESMLIDNLEGSRALMSRLCALGVRLCIDDFGTGYSSLSTLHMLPLHTLKVDRAFVREMGEDPRQTAIADTIIALAHTLGFEVIAEGIETASQQEALRVKKCAFGQGYLFSRPVDAAAASKFLSPSISEVSAQSRERLGARTLSDDTLVPEDALQRRPLPNASTRS